MSKSLSYETKFNKAVMPCDDTKHKKTYLHVTGISQCCLLLAVVMTGAPSLTRLSRTAKAEGSSWKQTGPLCKKSENSMNFVKAVYWRPRYWTNSSSLFL